MDREVCIVPSFAEPGFYAAHRPYHVVATLSELRGPSEGIVTLPATVHWGPWRDYDLSDSDHILWLYSRVLREANSVADLTSLLDAGILKQVWRELVLPTNLRGMWEARFPELRQKRSAALAKR
ncbi:MAG: hypothetical protein BGO26_05310 [Actinobacteria bacterium 69-20]|jgi:hypothetical protein|nr:MAG: hypothetical protein BGO26_05310 [Actinobacteria bacterium 69-20]